MVAWKRFNDFKNLYKAMSSLHSALHRREEFPDFVKSQVFSEYDSFIFFKRFFSVETSRRPASIAMSSWETVLR